MVLLALKDDCISLRTDLLIVGREDISRGRESRADTGKIRKGNLENRYVILADHQPVQIEENVRQGVDLQLSGHTHAGQFFPIGYMNTLFGPFGILDMCLRVINRSLVEETYEA